MIANMLLACTVPLLGCRHHHSQEWTKTNAMHVVPTLPSLIKTGGGDLICHAKIRTGPSWLRRPGLRFTPAWWPSIPSTREQLVYPTYWHVSSTRWLESLVGQHRRFLCYLASLGCQSTRSSGFRTMGLRRYLYTCQTKRCGCFILRYKMVPPRTMRFMH